MRITDSQSSLSRDPLQRNTAGRKLKTSACHGVEISKSAMKIQLLQQNDSVYDLETRSSLSHARVCIDQCFNSNDTIEKLVIRGQFDQGPKTKYEIRRSRNSSKEVKSLTL